jgi:hypothetical protein
MKDEVIEDGVVYARERESKGNRYVVVIDRGWIIAGNLTENGGRIRLDKACILRRFEGVGFEGAVADPKNDKVTIKKFSEPIDFPEKSEIFRVPVGDGWGL